MSKKRHYEPPQARSEGAAKKAQFIAQQGKSLSRNPLLIFGVVWAHRARDLCRFDGEQIRFLQPLHHSSKAEEIDFQVPAFFWRKQRLRVAERGYSLGEARRNYEATNLDLNYRIKHEYLRAEMDRHANKHQANSGTAKPN